MQATLWQRLLDGLVPEAAAAAAGGGGGEPSFILQLAPFFLGGVLPDFDAHGEGRFSFAPATGATALSGRLAAGVSRLEVIEPAWRA
ncbi:MAG: hypothetical protein HYU38_04860, partial [Candidatus Tectomicrobia bacterium]|nr:hypothetical protein [Candidatus Tectomicrobia bacterium]